MTKIRLTIEKEVPDGTDLSTVKPSTADKIVKRHEVTFLGFSVIFHESLGLDEKDPQKYDIMVHLGPRGSTERAVAVAENKTILDIVDDLLKELKKSV